MSSREPGAVVQLRKAVLHSYGLRNTVDIADRLGINQSTVWRVLNDASLPGNSFIAAVLRSFPDAQFADFFEVATTEEAA